MKHLLTAILLLAFAHTAAGERNVSLERDFGTLYGTLLTPDAGAETVAVIIAGSGPIPRNGSVNNYLYLAQALEKAGIASLRYDKRGIGASRFTEPEKMADAVLGDFIGDAAAWAAFCAAQQTPKVAAVVSLAGAGYPLDEILQLQLASQLLPDNMNLLLQANAITAALKRGERVESCPPQLEALFHPSVQTFWISSLRYDPREEIRKVRVPILVVGGDNDLQVPPDNAEALAKAQPRARKAIIAGMTHPLKKCTGRMRIDQTGAYGDSTLPIDPDLVAVVTQFIRGL